MSRHRRVIEADFVTRLYWRIFVSFWLVIVIAVVTTAGVNAIMFRDELVSTRADALRDSLDALAEQAQRRLYEHGVDGLRDWLRQRRAESPRAPLLIVGPDGLELLGRPLPPGAHLLVRLAPGGDEPRSQFVERMRRGMRYIADAAGERYVMMVPHVGQRDRSWFAGPAVRAVFPIALVIISGGVCLLLARYLARPIAAFRQAGQRIAAGDLTARVGPGIARRRDEFGELARDFDDMADRVQQLVDTQQRLLRDVSHELRSPLARLQATAGLMRQRGADDPNIERIEREIELLDALIGQILRFSRLQARTSLQREWTDLGELVAGVVEDAAFEGAARGRFVELRSGAPVRADVDAELLRSAVENVVRNALEFSLSRTTVDVVANPDAATVEVRVSDDGPGVAEQELERLFEPFFSGPLAGSGAGVGLAIARRAAELHGGTIRAVNRAEGGLVVTITLPAGAHPSLQV